MTCESVSSDLAVLVRPAAAATATWGADEDLDSIWEKLCQCWRASSRLDVRAIGEFRMGIYLADASSVVDQWRSVGVVETFDSHPGPLRLTVPAHRASIQVITERAVPEEPAETKSFLLAHAELLDPLVDAIVTAKQLYGDKTDLRLRLVRDPDGDFEEIFLVICTDRSIDDAFDLLDTLDRTWLLSQPASVRSMLNVTIGSKCSLTGEHSAA